MGSSGKNRKTIPYNEYLTARQSIERLEKELEQANEKLENAKKEVDEMKEGYEQLKEMIEDVGKKVKLQVLVSERERTGFEKRFKILEENIRELKSLSGDLKQPKESSLEPSLSVTDVGEPSSPPSSFPSIPGKDPRLVGLKILPPGQKSPTKIISHNQPFKLEMTLDFTGVMPGTDLPADCKVTVYAAPMGGRSRQYLTDSELPIGLGESTVSLEAIALQEGHYRLEVELALPRPGKESKPPYMFLLKGGSIHVC